MKNKIICLLKPLLATSIAAILLMTAAANAVPVNINAADADTIADALSGVGPKTAQKIVEYRKQNGDFTKVEELLEINGIGEKKLARFKVDVRFKSPSKK